MHGGESVLAVIPARGGSKGLPNKNIRDCAGRPLIDWTIAAARGAGTIDEVLVSTDSEEIAAVARRAGAAVPFLRPAELASDEASVLDVLKHAWARQTAKDGRSFDYVVLLQPTSPLRTAQHIEAAFEHYFAHRRAKDDTLASVYEVDRKYGWLMQRSAVSDYVRFCFDVRAANAQRQALSPYYLPNGAIFVARGAALDRGLYGERTLAFVMSSDDSVDVDSLEDLQRAARRLSPA